MNRFTNKFIFLLLGFFLFIPTSFAALSLELTQGVDSAIPVALVPFSGKGELGQSALYLTQVIESDLNNSGRFNLIDSAKFKQTPHIATNIDLTYWRKTPANDLIVGQITPAANNQLKVSFALIDIYRNMTANQAVIVDKTYEINNEQIRSLAHHISDIIYQKLTGERGIFSTRIAYVLVKHPKNKKTVYQLVVSDYDGHNVKPILTSYAPIMSPAWSPNGKEIAYVSFENTRASIYISNVRTGKRHLVTSFPGVNGAPAWSPDGKQLALVLSKSGNLNIYTYELASKKLTQLTNDYSINTEPTWAPADTPKTSQYYDSIIFTSDRGGSPQIYDFNLRTKEIQRVTFNGSYNATPSFTLDGKNLVLLHREDGMFNIAILNLNTGEVKELTKSGSDSSPSVAPNGKMVLFGSQYGGQGVLGIVSTSNGVTLRLPAQEGDVQDPAWGPFDS